MDINDFLANLSKDEFGWQAMLPESLGRFLGKPVRLEIETCALEGSSPPAVSREETALAKKILTHFAGILADAEKKFKRYTADDPDVKEQIRDPHVWICRDNFEDSEGEKMEYWTFVIGREDAPDFGYHIEFDGRKCLDIWAGD